MTRSSLSGKGARACRVEAVVATLLLLLVVIPSRAHGSVSFISVDTATVGNWKGVYGADGFQIANDATKLPSYAQVSISSQSNWTWESPTNDPRGLQQGLTSGRTASCWYSATNLVIDINITDGSSHSVALYVVDWPTQGRAQNITIVDASTGALLDTRMAAVFSGGQYFVWNVSGHVQARIILAGGPNVVVSGIFFGPALAPLSPPPPPPPGVPPLAMGPGGPILLIGTSANPFSYYYAEILRAEGMNAFATADIANVTASTLASYDLVILGQTPLNSAQVAMFTTWVNQGGNLIAMRPDKQLAGLLGIADSASTLSNAYLLVNTSVSPGAGIVNQAIQYHGPADVYTLSGATAVASLYLDASTATVNPAVTVNAVGSNSGKAAAFTYDLARSIVLTRQGNPAWAGEQRDAVWGTRSPQTPHNLFYGNASFDLQPDWINLDKSFIPQADEQQRLLINLIGFMNSNRKPLPRFWYFPFGKKAVVVMTGDDHANGGTAGRFDQYKSMSAAGCIVPNWECIRSTSYVYPFSPLTDGQALSYAASDFEVALHVTTGGYPWSLGSLDSAFGTQGANWHSSYFDLLMPQTNRTHATTWSDYVSQPKVELARGVRLDLDYATGPSYWTLDRVGFMNGSGMIMRFADLDGSLIDVYQGFTEMWDSPSNPTPYSPAEPAWINTLLSNALGSQGYYGAFTVLAHTDFVASPLSDAVLTSALPQGVPIVSSLQMLKWLDGKGNSSFGSLSWDGHILSFTITPGPNTNGLQAMLPATFGGSLLTGLTRGGSPVTTALQTIKGVSYAFFSAVGGNYQAIYGGVLPVSVSISPSNATLQSGQTQQFTASVTGSTNTTVTWSLSPSSGSISSTGLYTAPTGISTMQTVNVIATSQADATKSASVVVTLVPPSASASAIFMNTDATTQGAWTGIYGIDGFQIANDATNLPSYASVMISNQSNYTWAFPTSDLRALQQGAASGRVASTWYSATNFSLDINLTDGRSHLAALYMVDWENAGRVQRIDILDAGSGLVLDSRTASAFSGGQYLVWQLSGHLTVRVTRTGGNNGVTSGIFFATPGVIPAPTITQQTQNAAVLVGQSATFSVTAVGFGLSYQWQSKPSAASSFAIIAGATSASYTTSVMQLSDNGTQFQCVVSNSGGSVTSNIATLTVNPAPSGTAFVTLKTLGTLRNDYTGWIGMKITVGASPLTVIALGRIAVFGNSRTHSVKIINAATGADVPGATVSINAASGTPGSFAYSNLSVPITLSSNSSYYFVTQETSGTDFWYDHNTTIQTTNVASGISAVYSDGSSPYVIPSGTNQVYGPVDFRYQ